MRIVSVLVTALLSTFELYAQGSLWQVTQIKDPLTDKSIIDRATLTGEYMVSPSLTLPPNTLGNPVAVSPPRIVLLCSNKKITKQYSVLPSTALAALPPLPTSSGARIVESKI